MYDALMHTVSQKIGDKVCDLISYKISLILNIKSYMCNRCDRSTVFTMNQIQIRKRNSSTEQDNSAFHLIAMLQMLIMNQHTPTEQDNFAFHRVANCDLDLAFIHCPPSQKSILPPISNDYRHTDRNCIDQLITLKVDPTCSQYRISLHSPISLQ